MFLLCEILIQMLGNGKNIVKQGQSIILHLKSQEE